MFYLLKVFKNNYLGAIPIPLHVKLRSYIPKQTVFGIYGGVMARITVEDCQERVDNRFLLVQMAIKRVRQYREGYEPLIDSKNKEVVTALREIAAGKILPDDKSLYTPKEPEKD